jgi:hypothetical protein
MAISKTPRRRAIFISGLEVLNEFCPSESDTFVQAAAPAISSSLSHLNRRASQEVDQARVQELPNEAAAFRSVDGSLWRPCYEDFTVERD